MTVPQPVCHSRRKGVQKGARSSPGVLSLPRHCMPAVVSVRLIVPSGVQSPLVCSYPVRLPDLLLNQYQSSLCFCAAGLAMTVPQPVCHSRRKGVRKGARSSPGVLSLPPSLHASRCLCEAHLSSRRAVSPGVFIPSEIAQPAPALLSVSFFHRRPCTDGVAGCFAACRPSWNE